MALLAPGWHGKRWKCNKGEHFSQPPQHMGFGGGYCDHVWGYSCRLLRWHAAQQLVFSLTSRHALLQLQYGKQWGVTLAESDRATLRYDVIESLRFEGLHQLQGTEQSLEGWIQVGWVSIAVELKALDMILWKKHEKTRFNSWNIIKPILKGPAFVAPPCFFHPFFSSPQSQNNTRNLQYHLLTCPYPPYQEPFADGQSCDAVFLTFTETRLVTWGVCVNSQKPGAALTRAGWLWDPGSVSTETIPIPAWMRPHISALDMDLVVGRVRADLWLQIRKLFGHWFVRSGTNATSKKRGSRGQSL